MYSVWGRAERKPTICYDQNKWENIITFIRTIVLSAECPFWSDGRWEQEPLSGGIELFWLSSVYPFSIEWNYPLIAKHWAVWVSVRTFEPFQIHLSYKLYINFDLNEAIICAVCQCRSFWFYRIFRPSPRRKREPNRRVYGSISIKLKNNFEVNLKCACQRNSKIHREEICRRLTPFGFNHTQFCW